MLIDSLFPTTILRENDLLKNADALLEHITFEHRHSESNIHERPEFKPLMDEVLRLSNVYADYMNWSCDLYLSSMWYNVNKQHEDHAPHTHSNSLLSGVYYPPFEGINHSPIEFIDTRNRCAIAPTIREHNVQNSDCWRYSVVPNSILIFPAWLQHWVPTNLNTQPRISISFNVMMKGKAGHREALTHAEWE